MKKTITIDESKLAHFTAVAGAVLAGGAVNAQIVYTDVNPDIIIDTASGAYDLDFNNDAVSDLTLSVTHMEGAGTYSGFTYTYAGSVANAAPGIGGGIAQIATSSGSSASLMIAAMNNGDMIDQAGNFNSSGGPLAVKAVVNIPAFSYTYQINQGDWLAVSDKFLGVKFNIGANTHYGWARLDVSAGADTIRLKDFAYNQMPATGLEAGQMVGLEDISIENKVNFKTTLNEAFINVTPDLIGGRIVMFNMAGQEVKAVAIEDINTTLPFEGVETGIYTIAAQFDGGAINKKVYVK